VIFVLGLLLMGWLIPGPRRLLGITLDIHTLLYAALAVNLGYQAILFWTFTKVYGMREGVVPPDPWFHRMVSVATLERGLIAGLLLLLAGVGIGFLALGAWNEADFGEMSASDTMRLVIPSATAIMLAFQTAYGTFFLSVLEIRSTRSRTGAPPA